MITTYLLERIKLEVTGQQKQILVGFRFNTANLILPPEFLQDAIVDLK